MTTIPLAVVTGVLVLVAGSFPWGGLRVLNFRFVNAVPWAILPMALYLWAY